MTKEAFENAIAVVDGARRFDERGAAPARDRATRRSVELELDDFNRDRRRVPHVADMKPHGKFHMADLDRVGGVPVVMKE